MESPVEHREHREHRTAARRTRGARRSGREPHPRLRKKLDAATEGCAAGATLAADGTVTLRFGEDALVTLSPGPAGTITTAEQATCSCLLAPRCLHRAAALGAAPLADAPPEPVAAAEPNEPTGSGEPTASSGSTGSTGSGASAEPAGPVEPADPVEPAPALTAAQLRAAGALWQVAAEALAAGVTAGGAVVQAELLRAAHTARLAGLPRAEAAALRVVRGLRAARERRAGQRLGELTEAVRELLYTAGMLASGSADPALTGTARRTYAPGGSLQVHGLCREPVLSATGYGGVVTHLLGPDGTRYSVSDVRPGGLARARGAGSASVALGGATLDHAGLARGGLRIVGATVSAEGRLGAGRGVRATPLPGIAWTERPAAALFGRPAAEAVAELSADPEGAETALLGCDVTVVGAAGEHLLVRETRPDGPLLRLLPAHPHPELAHTENLRRIAAHPGVQLRVLGRPDLDRTATLRPWPSARYRERSTRCGCPRNGWAGPTSATTASRACTSRRERPPPYRSRRPRSRTRWPTPRCGGCAASWRPGWRGAAGPSPRPHGVRRPWRPPRTARCAGPGSPRRRTWPPLWPPRPTAVRATSSAAWPTPRRTVTPGPGWPRPPTWRRRNVP